MHTHGGHTAFGRFPGVVAATLPAYAVLGSGGMSIVPGSLTAALAAARTESDRTDAAFDAWLAVGPTADTEAETTPELDADAPARPAWVRPLEAAIALVAVAVVVVLALLLVG